MKKKMTVSEFEKWSRFASEIRDKTLSGEISFNEYYIQIRKYPISLFTVGQFLI